MNNNITHSFLQLKSYCEKERFKGWDPYDGLNSKVFNAIPFLNKSSFIRMVVNDPTKAKAISLYNHEYAKKHFLASSVAKNIESTLAAYI